MHGCGAIFARQYALIFLSLLLSASTFSHTKSVIIAQETRNTVTMLSLQKHDNYRKLSSIIFLSSCDTTRGKEGEEVQVGFGCVCRTRRGARLSGPANTPELCLCVWCVFESRASAAANTCTFRSGGEEGCSEADGRPGGDYERRRWGRRRRSPPHL